MTPELLEYLCEPVSKKELFLEDDVRDEQGHIISGLLKTDTGNCYPIINGIPRFVAGTEYSAVRSFGDEWNYFNFTEFKQNWLEHTVRNTFGDVSAFKDKLIVDAGGGSGAQSKWFLEYGARHVIILELSHSVDDVVNRNLQGSSNFDVIQCSIDSPPLKDLSINGIVYCHNVIQHTRSVEETALSLFRLVTLNGEFVFNCYPLNDQGLFRWVRLHLIYKPLRVALSHSPFFVSLSYAYIMATLRFIPILGVILEKALFCVQGEVPAIKGESFWGRMRRKFRATALNTFDYYGSHKYQHLKRDSEIKALVNELQSDCNKVKNIQKYFQRPAPIGCALRIFR